MIIFIPVAEALIFSTESFGTLLEACIFGDVSCAFNGRWSQTIHFSNCKDIKCRRVHYHDFMQDVHRRIHEAKKKAPPRDVSRWDTYQPFDPVPPVGDTIIEESWVICLDEFQVCDTSDNKIG